MVERKSEYGLTEAFIERYTDKWSEEMRKAFLDAVYAARDRVQINVIAAMLERRDLDAVLRYVGLRPEDFAEFQAIQAAAYAEAGKATANTIPIVTTPQGFKVELVFNPRNPAAETFLRERSSGLVQQIIADQRVAIQTHLMEGMAAGQNPRTTALDLAGRMNPTTKKREGGVIGLHSTQQQWLSNYKRDLASADPVALQRLLDRGLRDKRFDKSVQKAINEGTGLPASVQSRMATSYANRALKWRADNIARTETLRAMGAAQAEGYQQAIAQDILAPEHLRRWWITVGDTRVRPDHRLIPGMNKNGRAWNEPFQTPTGPSMHAPHDRDVQCRCHERVRVDFAARAVANYRRRAA